MFYRYNIVNVDGSDILYLYVDFNFEIANELGNINKKQSIVDKVSKYIRSMNIKFNGKKVYIIASGIIMASLLFMNNNVILNSKTTNATNNIITTEIYKKPIEKEETIKDPNVEMIKEVEPEIVIEEKIEQVIPPKVITQSPVVEAPKVVEQPKIIEQPKVIEEKTTEVVVETPVVGEQMITLYRSSGIVEQITITDYIIGVVGAEMPASFNVEALKSQAVVARTYVLKRLAEGKTINDTTNNQVYKDNTQLKAIWGDSFDLYYNKIKGAVTSTDKEVILYNGYYIDALYHSTSNGQTENPINVWGGSFPYLKSVDSHWDLEAPSYLKTTTKTFDEIAKKLEINIDPSTEINVLERSESNRINSIEIGTKTFDGVDIYNLLGLRSRDFDMVINNDNITITTRGYGHGVGMSQYGANGMAKEGFTYKEILNHYYQDINIIKKET